jgi:hypothetical protein
MDAGGICILAHAAAKRRRKLESFGQVKEKREEPKPLPFKLQVQLSERRSQQTATYAAGIRLHSRCRGRFRDNLRKRQPTSAEHPAK